MLLSFLVLLFYMHVSTKYRIFDRKGRKYKPQRTQKSLCALCEKLGVPCGKNFKQMKCP